jgi:PAS domain S-box-containing protein
MVKVMNEIPANRIVQPSPSDLGVIEELPVAYFELNAVGVVTCANRAARILHRDQDSDLVGRDIWEFVAEDEKTLGRKAFLAIMASGEEPPVIRRSLYNGVNEFRTYEMYRSLIRDAEGLPAGLRYAYIDVTEAQCSQEEAHQARQWLESVLASVAEAVIVTDGLGFVRTVNPAAEELLGWKAEEMIGKVIEKGMPMLEYTSADQKSLSHRIALEGRTRGIATVLDRARHHVCVEISTSPIVDKENGFTTGVVNVLRRVEEAGQACSMGL